MAHAGESDAVTDPTELAALARTLIEAWNDDTGEASFRQRERRPDVQRFVAVFGMAAHAYRMGESALDMFAKGLVVETAPLVRFAYECALKAVWMAQNEESAAAFLNEDVRQRRAINATFAETSTPLFRENAKKFPVLDDDLVPTGSDDQAKFFERLCNDLQPGGADAYVHYRFMSRYSHANIHIIDPYLIPDDDEGIAGLTTVPRQNPDSLWLFYVCMSLVWAGTAVDYIDADKKRRSLLRQTAKALGIPRDLHLTAQARQRIEKARREARRERRQARRTSR